MKDKTKKYSLFAGFIVILLLLIPSPSYASSYRVIFVTNILMYVILTLSWVIFSGPTGYISLADCGVFRDWRLYFGYIEQRFVPPISYFYRRSCQFLSCLCCGAH